VLSTEARVALTLRLLGGLTTEEIVRAFLVSESTVAQRIVRTKRTLTAARVPFEAPQGDERAARLSSVLEVLYLHLGDACRHDHRAAVVLTTQFAARCP
jgi:predicted RNA polymerase sigma factor